MPVRKFLSYTNSFKHDKLTVSYYIFCLPACVSVILSYQFRSSHCGHLFTAVACVSLWTKITWGQSFLK